MLRKAFLVGTNSGGASKLAARRGVQLLSAARCYQFGPGNSAEGGKPKNALPTHFRLSSSEHPLGDSKIWPNPTQNHIWDDTTLDTLLKMEAKEPIHVAPKGFVDKLTYYTVQGCYHTFNFITGYSKKDPTPSSIQYRVLILESIAGVPGMVAACIRHFRSLRTMKRDGGWIHTLLEEAENERMHLLVFMQVFTPGIVTRAAVIVMQYIMVGILTGLYVIRPQIVHRFVGYLEETAVRTYMGIIKHLEDPNSKLHKAWSNEPAPKIAIAYWRMPEDAKLLDVFKQICADEMHHRDVNHQFADMSPKDFNPAVTEHINDQYKARVADFSDVKKA